MNGLRLVVRVPSEAQHDGHGWSDDYVRKCEIELLKNIMSDIEDTLTLWIQKIKPFAVHQFKD
jgi:hypothetical protein